MKIRQLSKLFIVILLSVIFICSNAYSSDIQPRIVGGHEVQPEGKYPWIVGLIKADVSDLYQGQFCAGALISPTWVVTASHCVFTDTGSPLLPTELDVVLGVHDLSTDIGQRIDVKRIITHPAYNSTTFDNDIALLELNSSSDYQPLFLFSGIPTENILASLTGEISTIIGWGATSADGLQYPETLQEVQLPIVSNAVCSIYMSGITEQMLCAGYSTGGKDSCFGDSGGPLVVQINGNWVHSGVVSWGNGCAQAETYGVYSRTSQYKDFILTYAIDARFYPEAAKPVLTPIIFLLLGSAQ